MMNLRFTDTRIPGQTKTDSFTLIDTGNFIQSCQAFILPFVTGFKAFKADTAYRGTAGACRCGCSGKYYVPGSTGYKRIFNDFQKLVNVYGSDRKFELKVKIDLWNNDYCIDLEYPATPGSRNMKCITLYYHKASA